MNTETPGEAEISQYEVLIEDAYDPSIYIRVRVKQPPGAASNRTTHAYMDATFNELTYCGMNKSTSGKYTVSNLQGMEPATNTFSAYLNEEKWGAALTYSFTGGSATSPNNTGYMWGGLAFDVDTNILYGMTGRGDSTLYRMVVADLNNADIFGEKFPGLLMVRLKLLLRQLLL
jgi:hypothetical protein